MTLSPSISIQYNFCLPIHIYILLFYLLSSELQETNLYGLLLQALALWLLAWLGCQSLADERAETILSQKYYSSDFLHLESLQTGCVAHLNISHPRSPGLLLIGTNDPHYQQPCSTTLSFGEFILALHTLCKNAFIYMSPNYLNLVVPPLDYQNYLIQCFIMFLSNKKFEYINIPM